MTSIKFCGFVRPDDVTCAVQLGVNAIGLVFYSKSPRFIDLATAKQLRALIPSSIEVVGLFVNETPQNVAQIATQVGLDRLQLHGDETVQQCLETVRLTGLPWWRAIRCLTADDLIHSFQHYSAADGFLIDSFSPLYGGTGKTFDWQLLQQAMAQRITQYPKQNQAVIMSGGLHAGNVGAAIAAVAPWAVDVSSGIQGSHARVKDPVLMAEFVAAVRSADNHYLVK